MDRRSFLLSGTLPLLAAAQSAEPPVEFICPMDRGVRSLTPGRCSRCGMRLVPGIADAAAYPVSVRMTPAAPRAGSGVQFRFTVRHPRTGARVTSFEQVHEKLYHAFVISQDLGFFEHAHPRLDPGGEFRLDAVLPKPGMYRILSDFFPRGGSPQMVESTVIVPGGAVTPGTSLEPDLTPKSAENLRVSLRVEPERPIAGMKTMLFCTLDPAAGLEPYLGAWGHMLAASGDLIDMIHAHPFLAEGGPEVQFNVIFPRAGVHRVWVQFQRKGVVNTARFDVPVAAI